MMMIIDAFTHAPVDVFYTQNEKANDKTFNNQLLDSLPVGGLMVLDLGFYSFALFDTFTDNNKFFITRLRADTAYKTLYTLKEGPCYREQIIQMGLYRSNPCRHHVRLISVLWNCKWYHYITNVLDTSLLSAQQIVVLYRNRWRIEDAFNITKRLLNLAYFWVGDKNGVQIQIFVTWIFYAVLNHICQLVALKLDKPLQVISVEMVYRAFYHYSQEKQPPGLITYIVKNAFLLSIVKKRRKRHLDNNDQQLKIWGFILLV